MSLPLTLATWLMLVPLVTALAVLTLVLLTLMSRPAASVTLLLPSMAPPRLLMSYAARRHVTIAARPPQGLAARQRNKVSFCSQH
jgi:hypothetical protein